MKRSKPAIGGSRITLRTVASPGRTRTRGEKRRERLGVQRGDTTAHIVVLDPSMAGFLLFILKTSIFRKLQKNDIRADLRE